MTIPNIVTGDSVSIPVQLKKDGVVFDIPIATVVKAAIVSYDHLVKHTSDVSQVSTTSGADWGSSIVVVEFSDTETSGIPIDGSAYIEIQVELGGKPDTFFLPIRITKGLID